MVLINIYGKIQPIIISKKLGVGICNPDLDWVNGFCEDEFEEEILIHNHTIRILNKSEYCTSKIKQYSLSETVNNLGWREKGKSNKQIIAEHLVQIEVMNFKNSYLLKKNEYMDSPTCEPQYTTKFIRFCSFVTRNIEKSLEGQVPFVTYDSNQWMDKPLILNYLQVFSKGKINLSTYTEGCIKTLKYIGNLIDDFIITDDDFWLLDYIFNAVYEIEGEDAYHIFKVMSLIEMLIVKHNNDRRNSEKNETSTKETKRKLIHFITWDLNDEQKELFAEIVGDLRNKIAHGNFKRVQVLLEKYRNCFMKNFWYDECEYSIENWTYGNIALRLNEILANILWLMICDREKLKETQES